MSTNRDFVPPAPRQLRKNLLSFHPWRAGLEAVIGLFVGMVLCAATNQWWWLLLAPAGALLLAFDFWWYLPMIGDDTPPKFPIWWSHRRDRND